MHGELEPFSIVRRVHDGRINTVGIHNVLLVDIFHLSLDGVVLNIINDADSDKLRLVVYPDEQRVVDFTISIEETGVVVDRNLHETMKAII